METNSKKNDAGRTEADRERFMEELEEDPELRAKVQIFRDPKVQLPQPGQAKVRRLQAPLITPPPHPLRTL
eukprot:1103711-Prorocentrum_minimum.AAC.1